MQGAAGQGGPCLAYVRLWLCLGLARLRRTVPAYARARAASRASQGASKHKGKAGMGQSVRCNGARCKVWLRSGFRPGPGLKVVGCSASCNVQDAHGMDGWGGESGLGLIQLLEQGARWQGAAGQGGMSGPRPPLVLLKSGYNSAHRACVRASARQAARRKAQVSTGARWAWGKV